MVKGNADDDGDDDDEDHDKDNDNGNDSNADDDDDCVGLFFQTSADHVIRTNSLYMLQNTSDPNG